MLPLLLMLMYCINPDCRQERLRCLESRYNKNQPIDRTAHRRRRYECPVCNFRFSSIEMIINVRKTDDLMQEMNND
jgi:hypothetical protein